MTIHRDWHAGRGYGPPINLSPLMTTEPTATFEVSDVTARRIASGAQTYFMARGADWALQTVRLCTPSGLCVLVALLEAHQRVYERDSDGHELTFFLYSIGAAWIEPDAPDERFIAMTGNPE